MNVIIIQPTWLTDTYFISNILTFDPYTALEHSCGLRPHPENPIKWHFKDIRGNKRRQGIPFLARAKIPYVIKL